MDEEEYFARENTEKLRKLHKDLVKHMSQSEKDALKAQHHSRCPHCGMEMKKLPAVQGVVLMRCFECGGTFLDSTNAKKLLGHSSKKEHAIVEAILSWFEHEDKLP
jgi:Zn-finger nucleic acid-binding protein